MKTEIEVAKVNINKKEKLVKKEEIYNKKSCEYYANEDMKKCDYYIKRTNYINNRLIEIEKIMKLHKQICERWLKWLENLFNKYLKSYGCYFKDGKIYEIATNCEVEQSVEDKLYLKKIHDLKTAIKLYEQEGI